MEIDKPIHVYYIVAEWCINKVNYHNVEASFPSLSEAIDFVKNTMVNAPHKSINIYDDCIYAWCSFDDGIEFAVRTVHITQ